MSEHLWDRLTGVLLILGGMAVLGVLGYGWHSGKDWVVLTIFPMMGTPYIIAPAVICAGCALVWSSFFWRNS